MAIHAETHLEPGFVNPLICVRELFMAGRTLCGGMVCVTKNNVRRDSVDADPLNFRGKILISMALSAF
ncbi:hypothetical protein L0156_02535 [bacterium]|nr:hypothetical protein [bacterium]